jgi:hypothetical protein
VHSIPHSPRSTQGGIFKNFFSAARRLSPPPQGRPPPGTAKPRTDAAQNKNAPGKRERRDSFRLSVKAPSARESSS